MADPKVKSSINRATVTLTQAVAALQESMKAEKLKSVRLVPYLVGAPGQGKSAIVDQFCTVMNAEGMKVFQEHLNNNVNELKAYNKKSEYEKELAYQRSGFAWAVVHLRLSQCDPTDLKGVPVFQNHKDLEGKEVDVCSFAPPRLFPLHGVPESADRVNKIIFLDELAQANPTIQNLASNIIDGKVGDYELDFNRTFIIAAGNRKEDKSATFETPRNVMNRVCELHVITTYGEWREWAIRQNLNSWVIGFLEQNSNIFNEPVPERSGPYGTPRAWHKVAALVDTNPELFFKKDNCLALQMLIGLVGQSSAIKFHQWVCQARDKYSLDAIMAGSKVPYPDSSERDTLFGLIMEATYRINNLIKPIVSAPNWVNSTSTEERDKILIKALGKTGIASINNVYNWVADGQRARAIDAGFAVLLNKYQSEEIIRSGFRASMVTLDEFKVAKDSYNHLVKLMQNLQK